MWLANGGDTTMRNIREYLQKINLDMKIIVLSEQLFKSLYEYLINHLNY